MRLLIAVDDFSVDQVDRIRGAVGEWASVCRIPESTPRDSYLSALQHAEMVIGWPQPDLLAGTPVRLLQIGSSGWDAYEGHGLEASGILICSARGVYTVGVAEHCVAMMFALARRLPTHFHDKQHRIFRRNAPYGEIAGSTACIVGLGSIGLELAARCHGLGMRVLGVVRDLARGYPGVDELFSIEELKTAIRQTDHLFMTGSGNQENRFLFSADVLEAFRPTSFFYNTSRGCTVDEAALARMLSDGRLAGAGLDVVSVEPLPPDNPLWGLGDNVLITGHSAGISKHCMDRFCDLSIRNLKFFRAGTRLENRIF